MIVVGALALDLVSIVLDLVALPFRLAILIVFLVPDFAFLATLLVVLFAPPVFSIVVGACRQGRSDAEKHGCDSYGGLHG
jgi:hypothetical protein